MNETLRALGRLSFSLTGSGSVYRAIEEEAVALPVIDDEPILRFSIHNKKNLHKSNLGDSAGSSHHFEVGGLSNSFLTNGAFTEIQCTVAYNRKIDSQFSRLDNRGYLYPYEGIAKNFWYNIFDWNIQAVNVTRQQSWIHASGVERDGVGIAILARGGVGKTTAMLKLCTEHAYRYLSDDLAIIDNSGVMYRGPKRIQIYAYNLLEDSQLADCFFSGRTWIDRLQFDLRRRLKGPKSVRRRVSAEELFGAECCAARAKIRNYIFLERGEAAGLHSEDVSSKALAKRMAPIIMDEIEPYTRIERIWRSQGHSPVDDSATLENRTEEILRASFDKGRKTLLRVGGKVTPDDLAMKIIDIAG